MVFLREFTSFCCVSIWVRNFEISVNKIVGRLCYLVVYLVKWKLDMLFRVWALVCAVEFTFSLEFSENCRCSRGFLKKIDYEEAFRLKISHIWQRKIVFGTLKISKTP